MEDLRLDHLGFAELPARLAALQKLTILDVSGNRLVDLADWLAELPLQALFLGDPKLGNPLHRLPPVIRAMRNLRTLWFTKCGIESVPSWIGELTQLRNFVGAYNNLDHNPLHPELAAAYDEGLAAIRLYLAARHDGEFSLREAKLLLVGEGEVGKSCLLAALRRDPWMPDRDCTHGIEIKSVRTWGLDNEITLNGWDFGGQRVYRPTHQLDQADQAPLRMLPMAQG